LAAALLHPMYKRSGKWLSVIYLLDVSQSVSPSAVQSAIAWIEQANVAGHPDHARFVPFASEAPVFETLEGLKKSQLDRTGTNIERAVETALHSFSLHYLKRLVLITDGHETSGNLSEQLQTLEREGVRVYSIPLEERTRRDVRVEALAAPRDVATEELFPVHVQVYSQIATEAEVGLRRGTKTLATRRVQLTAGLNRVSFETSLKDEDGPTSIEADVTAANDEFPNNNIFHTSIVVHGRPKVLYVEGHPESSHYLRRALLKEGIAVNVVTAAGVPTAVGQLDRYDAIVVSDVARSDLTDGQMRAMVTYIRDLGGGFVLAGGENNYGEGGYSHTEIERVLPVTFDTKKERPKSVAMVVVLDRSGSMAGDKIDLAKEATKAPLDLLTGDDFFGVVAFDYSFAWAAPLQSAVNKQEITGLISEIIAGGETNIYPALEAAYNELQQSPSEVKHVILLSDGRTVPAEYDTLVKSMADAKITVSTIAVGSGADQELLKNIADWGKGRTYYLEDPAHVPQIFVKETQLVTGNTLREEPFKPVLKKTVQALKGINLGNAPELLGYVATRSKATSEVLLESGRKEPILARWQYGLGKTAVFTSDLKDRWAAEWLKWPGYSKFWSQLVRETMRKRDDSAFDFQVVREGDEATVSAEAVRQDGKFQNILNPKVRITAPDQSTSEVRLNQVAPGLYKTKFPLNQTGPYVFRVIDQSVGASRALEYSYPDEYHFYPPNTDALRKISTETGGVFQPTIFQLFDTTGESTTLPVPLWPFFAATALLLFIAELLLRRLVVTVQSRPAEGVATKTA